MVKKLHKSKSAADASAHLSGSVKDSAQQIWQAGLGAFSRAQAEGTKAFEALVKEGVSLQRKTQAVAEEKITEATQRMSSMATDISSKASGQWDKLETIFEDRVAKALKKLGVPSAQDVDALIARIDELNATVRALSGNAKATSATGITTGVAKAPKTAARTVAKKTPSRTVKAPQKASQAKSETTPQTALETTPVKAPQAAAKTAPKRARKKAPTA